MIYNKGKGSPEVLSLKNKTSQMDFHACNFSESERIIKQAKESMQNRAHTEVAKS